MKGLNIKIILVTIALGCLSFSHLANAQSLEEAVAVTLDTNPNLRAAFNRYKARQEQIGQAEAGYLPTIDADAGIGYEYTNSPGLRAINDDDQNLTRRELGITLRQMLFDGFSTSYNVDRASAETEAEKYALLAEAEDTALRVSQVYLDVIEAQNIFELSELNLNDHLAIQRQIKKRASAGVGTSSDLSQINSRVALARSNLIAAQNNLVDAKTQFIRVVNQVPESLVLPVPDAEMLPSSKEEGYKTGLDFNPTIISSRNDIDAATAQHEGSKSNNYPQLSFELQGRHDNDIDGIDGYRDDVSAMVRLRYNLFSGGRDTARIRETAYQINEAKEINDRAHRQLNEGVSLAWNAYELIRDQLSYIQEHVEAAFATKVAYKKQFNLGKRSLLDLLDTENELFEARRSYVSAETDYLAAQYRLLNATGKLLSSLRVNTPVSWEGEASK